MPKTTAAFLATLILSMCAAAQDAPKVEVFTGYSFNRVAFPLSSNFDIGNGHGNLQGWDVSAAVNPLRWVGLEADFAGYYGTATGSTLFKPPDCVLCTSEFGATVHHVYTFMAGPRIFQRDGKLTLFAHALFGGARTNADELLFFGVSNPPQISTAFAMVLGGGIDVQLSRHFALRAQPDYLRTQVLGKQMNNFRVSAGPVFRFGL